VEAFVLSTAYRFASTFASKLLTRLLPLSANSLVVPLGKALNGIAS